jgi:putative transcriptional regulator
MARLTEYGYTSYELRKERVIGQSTLQRLRRGESISANTLWRFADLLCCEPEDLMQNPPSGCLYEPPSAEEVEHVKSLGFGANDESDNQPDPERLTALAALFDENEPLAQ